jgi:hypothetical protein
LQAAIFTLFLAGPALAAPVGTLSGICDLRAAGDTRSVSFSAAPGDKLILGVDGSDGGAYKISIVNNGNLPELARAFGALAIGFSREDARFRNPPRLCPSAPEEARIACEAQEAHERLPVQRFSREAFERVTNDGHADAEYLRSGPTATLVPESSVRDSLNFETAAHELGGVAMQCRASFRR